MKKSVTLRLSCYLSFLQWINIIHYAQDISDIHDDDDSDDLVLIDEKVSKSNMRNTIEAINQVVVCITLRLIFDLSSLAVDWYYLF